MSTLSQAQEAKIAEVIAEETADTNRQWVRTGQRPRYAIHFMLIVICVFLSLPALYALQVSTLTFQEALKSNPPQLFPPSDDLYKNVQSLLDYQQFDHLLLNTLIVAAVVVVGKTATAMLAGLAFVYFRFPGKWFLFFFVLLTLLMPTEIILLPLFRLVADLEWGEKNPRLALTVPFLATATGAFLFRQHFSNIPREMAEAAQIDGASPLRFMTSVLLPMSWNVIVAHSVIQFVYMWNQFVWPSFIVSDYEDQMIQVAVRRTVNLSAQTDFGILMAAGVMASLPPLILFIVVQKQFMSGFALTRDK